jgi:hypothetical protein
MAWAPDYLTETEFTEDYKGLADVDLNGDETVIAWAITTASRSVDDHCTQGHDRQFGKTDEPEERLYTATWSPDRGRWVVEMDDFHGAVTVTVAGEAVIGSLALPLNAAKKSRPWEKLVLPKGTVLAGEEGEVSATATWGWASIPVAVKQATALQANRLLFRRSSPQGVAGSPETGSEVRLLSKVDPDVAVSLKDYVRRSWRLG